MKLRQTVGQMRTEISRNAEQTRARLPLRGMGFVAVAGLAAILLAAPSPATAAPVFGERRTLPQPDGSLIEVRIWGDEYYGITESVDGYTLIRDTSTLFFCYAALSADGNDLMSTGVPVGGKLPPGLDIKAHVRIKPDAAHAKAEAARAEWAKRGDALPGGRGASRGPTTGNVVGICLIVDFSNDVGTIAPSTVSNYCNQIGFNTWGNNGSVRDYYYDVSDGHLTYTNYVPPAYYRAAHPKSYYTDPSISYGQRAQELITEALNYLESSGFNFSQYDANHDGTIDALNCFYAGDCPNNWAEGLWPHAGSVGFCADGVCTNRYQITDMGSSLYLSTFCHENGHMLMGWPDLYDYDYDSTGVGQFCLMCYGTSSTNPCEPCAYMKYIAGWSTITTLTTPQSGIVVPSAPNTAFKYNNPSSSNEFYIIENRQRSGRDSGIPDAGLAIWHIDTNGDNSNQQMTPSSHYLVTLVQADGRWDMEHDANYGDSTDLWKAPTYTQCTPTTTPNTNWWSGSSSGLSITHISSSSASMTMWFNMNDCNNNGVADDVDIAHGTSQDCNGDGVPDECQSGDICPPTPNPPTWITPPTAVSTSAITMQAHATDPSGVQYYFGAAGIGCHSRTWGGDTYTDSGLATNWSVSYRVKARDQSASHNETGFCDAYGVATAIETPTGLSFGSITNTSIQVTALDTFSNLADYQSGVYIEVTKLDGTPVGGSQANVWRKGQTITATGLSAGTQYRFRVKARNNYAVETPWYPTTDYALRSTTGGVSCALPGDVNQDTVVNALDIAGFVRAKLGLPPEGGENQNCSNYGGSLEHDVNEFVADLLGI